MGNKRRRTKKSVIVVPERSSFRELLSDPFVHILIIIALGFIIYMSTSEAPFVLDDEGNVSNNPALKDMTYFTDRRLQDKALTNQEIDEHFRSRIVGYLTFALNYKLHGARVPGYHVFSVLVHLANAILVYLLVILTTRTPWFRKISGDTGDTKDPYSYRTAALLAALLFVSHPVQTQAVTYITQRFTALATMFCLLSLMLYIKARLIPSGQLATSGQQSGLRTTRYVLYSVSVLSAVLAMKTKQISFTLPMVVALYEVMFFEGKARRRLFYLLPLLLTMLIVSVATIEDRNILTDIKRLEASAHDGQGKNAAVSYFLTQFRVIVTYLRLLVLPVHQNLDYDYPVYHNFFNPAVFLSFMFLAGILMAGLYLYRRSSSEGGHNRQWLRVIAFGIFWFFITLSVESSIIPLADVIFEHRLYYPSVGFFMVVISTAAIGKSRFGRTGSQAITLFLVLAVLALSVATFQRNQLWGDNVKLWEDVVQKSPNKSRPHNNLGVCYEAKGETNKAVNEYLAALKINPNLVDARINLGVAYGRLGFIDMAVNELQSAIKISPRSANAHNNLGVAYEKQGHTDKAIDEYLAALDINPDFVGAHNNLGIAYRKQGYTEKAINEFVVALKINPNLAEAHNNIGFAYEKQGYTDKAVNEYLAALKINPNIAEIHHNLGIAYGKQGYTDKAIEEFIAALKLNPTLAIDVHDLESAPADMGRINKAVAEFQKNLKIDPEGTKARRNLEIPVEQRKN